MSNAVVAAAATGLPAATPLCRLSKGDEFLVLMDQRRRIDARLNELAEHFGANLAEVSRLPKSKLRIVVNKGGALLCKGGPING